MDIGKLAQQYQEYIVQQRRYFHQHPELSLEETHTTAALQTQLELMGIPVTRFSDFNGLVGTIQGGKPGGVVMLRADIDALPIQEHTQLSFAADNGKMHACGHDAHMAMLLGAAKILTQVQENICGTVKLLFQSAEETCHGAEYYTAQGVLQDVSAIVGLHIWGTLNAPYFNLESGGRMASCDNFKITVQGEASHGSAPHLGKDAIVAAASIIMNLQTFVSRVNDPLNPLVVTIGTIQGGQRFNIIADQVEMEGTIRTFSPPLRKTLQEDLRRLICQTAQALGCAAQLDYEEGPPPVINQHENLNRIARQAAIKLYGEDCLAPMPRLTSSEDFAYFMDEVPGYFGFLGCRNEELGCVYSNHSDKFQIDESVLQRGAAFYAQFALDFLEQSKELS